MVILNRYSCVAVVAHIFITLNVGMGRSTVTRTRKDGSNQEKIQQP
jgi:hypothetical protein